LIISPRRAIWTAAALLFLYWLTRTYALTVFPLFLDEASHLTRAQGVWRGSPFYLLETGKALAPYLAALFYPFSGAVFIGRYAVILLGVLGLAAGYGVGRALHSRGAGILLMALWIGAPHLFFFERMTLVDTTIGAMAMVALWWAIRALRSGRPFAAVLCGAALALTVFAKLTGLVFLLLPILAALFITEKPFRLRLRQAGIALLVAGVILAPAALYILSQKADPTGQSTALTSLDPASLPQRAGGNIAAIANAFRIYYGDLFLIIAALTVIGFVLTAPRRALLLIGGFLLPLAAISLTANSLWLRYTTPAAPFLLLIVVIGAAVQIDAVARANRAAEKPFALATLWAAPLMWIAFWGLPFMITAYGDPAALRLPEGDRAEYITWIPGGFGIAEASAWFSHTQTPITVIGTAVNCHAARLMTASTAPVTFYCPPLDWGGRVYAPIVALISERLAAGEDVYLLTEDKKPPTLPNAAIPAEREEMITFQRPGGRNTVRIYRLRER